MMKKGVGYGVLVGVTILCAIAFYGFLHVGEAARVAAAAQPGAGVERGPSCVAPDAVNVERCREMEARILAVTLRLRIEELTPIDGGGYEVVDHSIGHATVMAGRYLVTHNHFSLSLEDLNDGRLRRLSAYGPDGAVIVQDAPFHTFDVRIPEPQTLVFDFGTYGREGMLAYAGFASAEFADLQMIALQPGDEVAQVNWDGRRTFVEWVGVSRTRLDNGTPTLELDSFVARGASGGGIFFEGVHVGNNWFHGSTEHTQSGEVLRQYTVAALNGANLMALAVMDTGGAASTVDVSLAARESLPVTAGVGALAQ